MARLPATFSTTLDERQLRAVALIAEGRALVEVAKEVGVDRTTIWKWRNSTGFAKALSDAMSSGLEAAKSRIAALREKSLDVIESILDDVGAPPAVRLKAVEMVWSRSGLGVVEESEREDVSADDARLAFREFAREHPDEARAMLEDGDK